MTQFRKAKADKRISAIMLDIDASETGWAKAEEIRGAIEDFRTSGKPVYAYMEMGFNKDYYIASACDKIYMPPPGRVVHHRPRRGRDVFPRLAGQARASIRTSTRSANTRARATCSRKRR